MCVYEILHRFMITEIGGVLLEGISHDNKRVVITEMVVTKITE